MPASSRARSAASCSSRVIASLSPFLFLLLLLLECPRFLLGSVSSASFADDDVRFWDELDTELEEELPRRRRRDDDDEDWEEEDEEERCQAPS